MRRAVVLALVVTTTACTASSVVRPVDERSAAQVSATCAVARRVVPDVAADEAPASDAAHRFLTSISRRGHDTHVAWSSLDRTYMDRMGWERAADFASSEAGKPYGFGDVDVSSRARLVGTVGGAGSLPASRYRDFLLARAGITRSECSERSRERLALSTWFLTISPVGGNAPAYVLVVHRPRGYRILSSDV